MTFANSFAAVTAKMLCDLNATDPSAINRGNCDVWANRMQALVGGRAVWLGDLIDVDEFPINAQQAWKSP